MRIQSEPTCDVALGLRIEFYDQEGRIHGAILREDVRGAAAPQVGDRLGPGSLGALVHELAGLYVDVASVEHYLSLDEDSSAPLTVVVARVIAPVPVADRSQLEERGWSVSVLSEDRGDGDAAHYYEPDHPDAVLLGNIRTAKRNLSTTIADPTAAPLGREPRALGVAHISPRPNDRQHYRTEAWDLTNGTRVVIVSENGGTSLLNADKAIAAAVEERWGDGGLPPEIIEDWGNIPTRFAEIAPPPNARFLFARGGGGAQPVDFDEWDAVGLVLPR